MIFEHQTHGRNRKTALSVAIMAALVLYLHSVGTIIWILLAISAMALPALFDLATNATTQFRLSDQTLSWKNRGQDAEIPLSEITKVTFAGRLDLSVRVRLTLRNGRKIRIPQDVLPKDKILESELKKRGISTERHPFTLL